MYFSIHYYTSEKHPPPYLLITNYSLNLAIIIHYDFQLNVTHSDWFLHTS
jgi:hypothetical protein